MYGPFGPFSSGLINTIIIIPYWHITSYCCCYSQYVFNNGKSSRFKSDVSNSAGYGKRCEL